MNLIEKQKLFPQLLAKFYMDLKNMGYEFTQGEAYRPPETAKLYSQAGKGITNSLHCLRLALDLNLFKNNVFLTKLEDYRPAGELWESYSTSQATCAWGGRFQDADHFSLSHNGVR